MIMSHNRSSSLFLPFAALAVLTMFGWPGCGKYGPADPATDDGSIVIATGTTSSGGGGDADDEQCTSHADCASGEACHDNACVPNLPGGACDADYNCVEMEVCDNGECVPEGEATDSDDMNCGGEVYQATAIQPNVLIVLDRSGSMNSHIEDQGSKWDIANDAIAQVVEDFGNKVLFGLSLFPGLDIECDDGMSCGPGAVFVDVGPDTATEITELLDDADTCTLGTPTAEALAPLQDYAGLEAKDRPNFILLITDGQSSCEEPAPVVEALHNQSPEIKTFVVGFGGSVDPDELNGMAQAGGTALEGDPMYYEADDAQSLVDAFAEIAGSVLSCSYVLDIVPPDPDELYVYIHDMEIPRDPMHTNGWDYEAMTNQITFYGPACELLQSGEVTDLQIIFGCPEAL
jgi:hypothetical protein